MSFQSQGIWFGIDDIVNDVASLSGVSGPRRKRRGYGVESYLDGFDNEFCSLAQPFRAGIKRFQATHRAFTPLYKWEN